MRWDINRGRTSCIGSSFSCLMGCDKEWNLFYLYRFTILAPNLLLIKCGKIFV